VFLVISPKERARVAPAFARLHLGGEFRFLSASFAARQSMRGCANDSKLPRDNFLCYV
jgi:hypothetical protein